MTFNEKIDKFMKEKNIPDLKNFSNLIDIPYNTIRDIYTKKGANNSRLSTIRKIAEYMKCTMDYLSFDELDYEYANIVKEKNYEDDINDLLKAYKCLPKNDKEWLKNIAVDRNNFLNKNNK